MTARVRDVTLGAMALLLAACGPGTDPLPDDGAALYVTSGATDQVYRLDPATGAITDTITVDRRMMELDEPHGVATSPDGRHWYVTLSHGAPTLWRFETDGDRPAGQVELGMWGAARIGFAGGRAFIPDYDRTGASRGRRGEVAVVDLDRFELVDRLALCAGPHHAEADRAGRLAVACSMGDEIVLLDAESLEETARFPVGPEPGEPGQPTYKPLNVQWSPDGARLYVALHAVSAIGVFEPTGTRLASYPVDGMPAQIALTSNGRTLIVANRRAGTLQALDAATGAGHWSVPVGAHPHGVALDEGDVAFVAWEGTTTTSGGVTAVRIVDGAELWTTRLGSYVLGVAYAPGPPDVSLSLP